MSETTVYSALRQLADDGLIEAVPGGAPAPPHRVEYRPVSVDLVR
jgi:DNA-binding GntR family transcriptional regulator